MQWIKKTETNILPEEDEVYLVMVIYKKNPFEIEAKWKDGKWFSVERGKQIEIERWNPVKRED